MSNIIAIAYGNGWAEITWRVRIFESTERSISPCTYRGITVHGRKGDPLSLALGCANDMHHANMIARGRVATKVSHATFFDESGREIKLDPQIPIEQLFG